jgi:two-component system nitrogen regulation sensor histidine kinase NtrY
MSSEFSAVVDSRSRMKRQLETLWRSGKLPALIEILTLLATFVIAGASYFIVIGRGVSQQFLTPLAVAGLLVANLVPVMALLVLIARRIARGRSAQSLVGGRGRLHVRLVALFSVIASVPTLLVVVFASLLFQYGVEFWFSDRAKTVLVNADRVAQAYVQEHKERILGEIAPMAGDLRDALSQASIDDPRFSEFFARQVAYRVLSEAAILSVGSDDQVRLIGGANLDKRATAQRLPADVIPLLRDGQPRVTVNASDRVEAVVLLDPDARLYLYVSRRVDPVVLSQVARARTALSDYNAGALAGTPAPLQRRVDPDLTAHRRRRHLDCAQTGRPAGEPARRDCRRRTARGGGRPQRTRARTQATGRDRDTRQYL